MCKIKNKIFSFFVHFLEIVASFIIYEYEDKPYIRKMRFIVFVKRTPQISGEIKTYRLKSA